MIRQSNWSSYVSSCCKRHDGVLGRRWGWRVSLPVLLLSSVMVWSPPGAAGQRVGDDGLQSGEGGSELDPPKQASGSAELDSGASPRTREEQKNWAVILQDFMSTPARRELAAEVGELLAQGDAAGARQLLSSAIEAGTLAVLIFDDIQDPALRDMLQARAGERQAPLPTQDLAPHGPGEASAAKIQDLDKALEAERIRADAALEELSAVQDQLAALTQSEGRAAELEQAIKQEKERAASAERELGRLQKQLADVAGDAATMAESRGREERERARAEAALTETIARLNAANEQIAALQKSAAEATDLKQAIQSEKEHSALASQEASLLKQQLVALQASPPHAADLESSVIREKRRADAALQQLNAVQSQLSAARASEAKMHDEVRQEREQKAATLRQLEASLKEVATQAIRTASLTEIKKSLEQEKAKAAAANHELEALRKRSETVEDQTGFTPAALVFQTPLAFLRTPAYRLGGDAEDITGAVKGSDNRERNDQRVSLPAQPEVTRKPPAQKPKPQARSKKPVPEAEEVKEGKQSSLVRERNAAPSKASANKVSRDRRLPSREDPAISETFVLDLPPDLLPADGVWQFY